MFLYYFYYIYVIIHYTTQMQDICYILKVQGCTLEGHHRYLDLTTLGSVVCGASHVCMDLFWVLWFLPTSEKDVTDFLSLLPY